MAFVLVVEVDTAGSLIPTRSTIEFDLPGGGSDAEAVTVARGIRAGFRQAYDSVRVRVVSFQQTGLSREVTLGA